MAASLFSLLLQEIISQRYALPAEILKRGRPG
jgi:hypothetical protein